MANNTTAAKAKNNNIQMLRGICALMVFLSHSLYFFPIPGVETINHTPLHLLYDGQCAVMLFFVMGGYFYYRQTETTVGSYAKGVWKKMVRIYPPHLICLAVGIVAITLFQNADTTYAYSQLTDWANTFWHDELTVSDVAKNALLLSSGVTDLINPPIWYLVIEVRMLVLLPLLLWLCQRTNYVWLYLLMIPAAIMHVPFLNYLFPYLMGMVLHRHEASIRLTHKWMYIPILLLGIFLLDLYNIFPLDTIPEWLDSICLALQSVGAAMIIYCIKDMGQARSSKAETVKADARTATPRHTSLLGTLLVKMGNISYEFYLAHFILLLTFSLLLPIAYLTIPLTFAASILAAYIYNKVVKRE